MSQHQSCTVLSFKRFWKTRQSILGLDCTTQSDCSLTSLSAPFSIVDNVKKKCSLFKIILLISVSLPRLRFVKELIKVTVHRTKAKHIFYDIKKRAETSLHFNSGAIILSFIAHIDMRFIYKVLHFL